MGPMILFTGYRTLDRDLHAAEKADMVRAGVLDQTFLALSRHPPTPKVIKIHSNSMSNHSFCNNIELILLS